MIEVVNKYPYLGPLQEVLARKYIGNKRCIWVCEECFNKSHLQGLDDLYQDFGDIHSCYCDTCSGVARYRVALVQMSEMEFLNKKNA